MNSPLYMIELFPDPEALIRFAETQGINRREDEDLGYVTHAWLNALFGEHAPKPFRLLQDRHNRKAPRLLGFTQSSGAELAEHARAFASALAMQVCRLDREIPAKAMPNEWRAGRLLGFELLACPITRRGANEDDVYRRHRRACDVNGTTPNTRADLYRDWLIRQFGNSCRLEEYRLEAFRTQRMLRKSNARTPNAFLAPRALFAGNLEIIDDQAFAALLARGVGRHRAFGFGMLLLRPAS